MDTQSKIRFKSLSILWEGAWDNFHKRTRYEWKFCFMFWTAFIGLISMLMVGKIQLVKLNIVLWVGLIGGAFTGLHIWWIRGIKKANKLDRLIAVHYERIMQEISNSIFPKKLQEELDEAKRKWENTIIGYSHGLQIGITIMLYFSAIIISRTINN